MATADANYVDPRALLKLYLKDRSALIERGNFSDVQWLSAAADHDS